MDAWGTLLATIVGAAIALLGQHLVKRAEGKARLAELLLEQCALLAASSRDFQNRVWEEQVLSMEDRVSNWDLSAHELASARLHILSTDQTLLSALDELNKAGQQLGSYWRRGNVDQAGYTSRLNRYRAATAQFIAASGAVVRRRLSQA
ncbi:hypothetical protein ACH4TV_28805 [Streptomyces sp. NPDC020898]|uniref:hypothetical protein n=1 Tax=Streptomyces sp. NPDC020898 TaxID=3365101 RepID=UPI0037A4E9FF